MSEPSCPSCSVAYVDHLGLIGTCAELKEARKRRPMPACLKALIEDAKDAVEGSDFNYPDWDANLAATEDLFAETAK